MVALGVDTPGASIIFIDQENGVQRLYNGFGNPQRVGISWTSPQIRAVNENTAVFEKEIELDPAFFRQLQIGSPWSEPVKGDDFVAMNIRHAAELGLSALFPVPEGDRVITNVPFEYGAVGFKEAIYEADHVAIVQELTSALSLGYIRFLDFQQLESDARGEQCLGGCSGG